MARYLDELADSNTDVAAQLEELLARRRRFWAQVRGARRSALLVPPLVAAGIAIGFAWGWWSTAIFAAVAAYGLFLATALSIFATAGGSFVQDLGRASYERSLRRRG